MRVALNAEQLLQGPSGIGRYTAELTRRLPQVGVEVVAFVARHPRARVEAALRDAGLVGSPVIAALPRPLLYDSWHVLGVAGPLRHVGPVDLVHAPSLAVPPRGDRPLVVTAHDAATIVDPRTSTRRGRWFHARGLAAAARRADLVIAVSRFAAEELATLGGIPAERIRVVPNGVELRRAPPDEITRIRAELGLREGPYVLWAGVAQPRKNLATLLEAFAGLVTARAELPHRLVLAGPPGWRNDDLDAGIARLGNRVVVTGAVPADRMAALFAGAELFVLPSTHEGFGLPALEAMAQETAVLCSDIPALREVAGEAARFVEARDTEGWGAAIAELLDDEAARVQLATRGVTRAEAFDWIRCAEATAAVYAEAVGNGGR
jgi:glycosyltransferase involved in cell wall biosynthesis